MAEAAGVPFLHVPVTPDTKAAGRGHDCSQLVDEQRDRPGRAGALHAGAVRRAVHGRCDGRAINIHHSFLPSFKGAKPYHQAYDRGVK